MNACSLRKYNQKRPLAERLFVARIVRMLIIHCLGWFVLTTSNAYIYIVVNLGYGYTCSMPVSRL